MVFFYGVEQEGVYGAGILIKLSPYFEVKGWIKDGRGTNSIAELLALWGILFMAKHCRITDVLIVGDSKVMISWDLGVANL